MITIGYSTLLEIDDISSLKLVDKVHTTIEDGKTIYAVRFDINQILDMDGKPTNRYTYKQALFSDMDIFGCIQKIIIKSINLDTNKIIRDGFVWNGINVYLSDENKFNFKAIIDEVALVEETIKNWDYTNGEPPSSMLPITMKLGKNNTESDFYLFKTLSELRGFFSAGLKHISDTYSAGWQKIANFDWSPYVQAINEIK